MGRGRSHPSIGNGTSAGSGKAVDQAVLDALPDMLFRINRAGEYLAFKPAEGLEPYVPPSELLGRKVHEILPEEVADTALPAVQQAIDTGETQVIRYQLEMPDGVHAYEARVVALGRDEALAIVRDTTKQPLIARPAPEQYGLTKRELVVLRLAAAGNTDKEIAAELGISPMTVRKHIAHILRRMKAASRTEACVRAVRERILG